MKNTGFTFLIHRNIPLFYVLKDENPLLHTPLGFQSGHLMKVHITCKASGNQPPTGGARLNVNLIPFTRTL